jgi:hypothetical protein
MAVALVGVILFFLADPRTLLRDFTLLALAGILAAVIYGIFSRTGWAARLTHWLED